MDEKKHYLATLYRMAEDRKDALEALDASQPGYRRPLWVYRTEDEADALTWAMEQLDRLFDDDEDDDGDD